MSTTNTIGARITTALPQTPAASPQTQLQSTQDMLDGLNSLTASAPATTARVNDPNAPYEVEAGTIPTTPSNSIANIFWSLFQEKGTATPPKPTPTDSSHPPGSIKTTPDGVITTPGGYKIEATGKHEWKVTGPDNKTTRVWGDPHVDEGDGGKWDFKRDSTFVLGDGTRINCSTVPFGNGMTVTGSLEIIAGNNRIEIKDIDKGKGKVGPVTQDGYAHANSFGNKDVFVMGKETDDWSFTGKEIIGDNNGGESFKLGGALAAGAGPGAANVNSGKGGVTIGTPGTPGNTGIVPGQVPGGGNTGIVPGKPAPQPNFYEKLSSLFAQMSSMFQLLNSYNSFNSSPYNPYNPFMYMMPTSFMPQMGASVMPQMGAGLMPQMGASVMPQSWLATRQTELGSSFESIGRMMDQMSTLDDLSRSVNQIRKGF